MAVSLSSVPAALANVRAARDIAFGTYFLPPGAMREALISAARDGAHVAVTLQRDPYRNPYGERANAEAARAIRAAGGEVTLLPSDVTPFHLKAAVCDGVAYLDDRNWTKRGPEIVLRDDDPADVTLVRDALHGRGGADPALATRKDVALQREIDLIDRAGNSPVVVETETLNTSPLTRALMRHAAGGAATTVIVGTTARATVKQQSAIGKLRAGGVEVRTGGTNEKLALAGERAWLGSGNATGAAGRGARQLEWGYVTDDRAIIGAVRGALARDAA